MKEIFINSNLKNNEIADEEVRVKGLIINSNNQILLGYSYNTYQFPGGHLEAGESVKDCLKREILEETGMDISKSLMMPLISIKYFVKKQFNEKKSKCNKLYYYVIKTDNCVNLKRTNYTKEEKDGNYVLRYINMDDVEEVLIEHANKYPSLNMITYEMLLAIKEYKTKNLN